MRNNNKIRKLPRQVLRSRIGERKLSKTNTDGVIDFLRTLPKETVVDFRLFRLAGMLRILADFLDY